VALCALPFLVLAVVVGRQYRANPGVELTVLRDDGHGNCAVRWTDPLDGRTRQGPFACDSGRLPILQDWEYGWEASSWPWRGDLYNADGGGTSQGDVVDTATLAGLALLLVSGVGGSVRIARGRRARQAMHLTPPLPGSEKHVEVAAPSRAKPLLSLAAGVAALAASGVLFGLALPSAQQDEKTFRAALPCPSAVPTGSITTATDTVIPSDCLTTESFTVHKVQIRNGKKHSYTADLAGSESAATRRVRFDDTSPLLERLQVGDMVNGTLWRGSVVALTSEDGRTRQPTSADPTNGPGSTLFGGIYCALAGAALTIAGLHAGGRAPKRSGRLRRAARTWRW
jgi:hypothetical protein